MLHRVAYVTVVVFIRDKLQGLRPWVDDHNDGNAEPDLSLTPVLFKILLNSLTRINFCYNGRRGAQE